jgi:hypothetical protein
MQSVKLGYHLHELMIKAPVGLYKYKTFPASESCVVIAPFLCLEWLLNEAMLRHDTYPLLTGVMST